MMLFIWLIFSGVILLYALFKKINLKSSIIGCTALFFILFMIFFPVQAFKASTTGIALWIKAVVPALLPFLILSDIIVQTDIINIIGKFLTLPMKLIFNTSGESSAAFILGMVSGYPIGAKVSADLYSDGLCTKQEAQKLIGFTNNCGPMFMLGTVAIGMYGIKNIGILLLLAHYAGCITLGILLRLTSSNTTKISLKSKNKKPLHRKPFGILIGESVQKASLLILIIGCFIILFSVVICAIKNLFFPHNTIFSNLILGSLEMTNGVNGVYLLSCSLKLKMILSSFLIGFGGISVTLQTITLIKDSDLNILKYILSKLIHGILASAYCCMFFNFIIDKNSVSVYNNLSHTAHTSIPLLTSINILCLLVVFILGLSKLLYMKFK